MVTDAPLKLRLPDTLRCGLFFFAVGPAVAYCAVILIGQSPDLAKTTIDFFAGLPLAYRIAGAPMFLAGILYGLCTQYLSASRPSIPYRIAMGDICGAMGLYLWNASRLKFSLFHMDPLFAAGAIEVSCAIAGLACALLLRDAAERWVFKDRFPHDSRPAASTVLSGRRSMLAVAALLYMGLTFMIGMYFAVDFPAGWSLALLAVWLLFLATFAAIAWGMQRGFRWAWWLCLLQCIWPLAHLLPHFFGDVDYAVLNPQIYAGVLLPLLLLVFLLMPRSFSATRGFA